MLTALEKTSLSLTPERLATQSTVLNQYSWEHLLLLTGSSVLIPKANLALETIHGDNSPNSSLIAKNYITNISKN
ncbi:MAG: hypothetical protein JNM67_13055 [Bacteroidetes bacterium]|nr:hypothetical protein [Bacteroidota bacterium]